MKKVERTFLPGSKWLYFKVYSGTKTADAFLAIHFASVLRKLKKDNLIDKWFFIRYTDPDFHLRIRFLVKEEKSIGPIINLFYKKTGSAFTNKLFWKVQIDTYNRELERYGNNTIEHSESIFHIDSECVLALLLQLNITRNENYRWMIALKLIDSLLSDFQLDLSAKQNIMEALSASFKKEFGFNTFNSKQFKEKHRENKLIIEEVLNEKIKDSNFLKMYSSIHIRSKALKPVVQKLKDKESTNFSLINSYLHMMLNRLFLSKNRLHELVLYDYMHKYYKSEIAKEKYKNKNALRTR